MGTRADFYVGRGESAEWLGSIAWDGYPEGVTDILPVPFGGQWWMSEEMWRQRVARFLAERHDATTPDMGWPWPWDDSGTTDYAYAYDDGEVWASCFGSPWWLAAGDMPDLDDEPDQEKVPFPDMSARKNTTMGPRSGVIIVAPRPDPRDILR